LAGVEFIVTMSADGLTEKLIGCFDCKQGAVRAVRFNGECVSCSPCVASPARKLTREAWGSADQSMKKPILVSIIVSDISIFVLKRDVKLQLT